MVLGALIAAVFLAFTLWPFAPKERPLLTEGPRLAAPFSDVAAFDCDHAEVFIDRHHVERPSITIAWQQRPPDRPV